MANYRIVKVTEGSATHYEVQKKGLFGFWNTKTCFDSCIDGLMTSEYPIKFKSIEKAKEYISNQNITKEIVDY